MNIEEKYEAERLLLERIAKEAVPADWRAAVYWTPPRTRPMPEAGGPQEPLTWMLTLSVDCDLGDDRPTSERHIMNSLYLSPDDLDEARHWETKDRENLMRFRVMAIVEGVRDFAKGEDE